MKRHLTWLGLCALWPMAIIAATATLPPNAVLVAPEAWSVASPRTDTLVRDALAHIARGDSEAALAKLHSEADPVHFEAAAVKLIDALQGHAPTPAGERLLAALEREPVRVFQRHEETAADWFQPVFNVPARAASARELLAAGQRRDALLAKLERDPRAAAQAPEPSTLAAAIERLSPGAIGTLSAAALRGDVTLPSVAWTALARRNPAPDILDATLREATPLDLLPLMDELPASLAPNLALDWLQAAAQKTELASSAVLGLGKLVPRLAKAEAALAEHLGDPDTGASAAAALAQLAVPDRIKRIDAWLARADTAQQLNDLALALRLEGSPAAQTRLRELAADPRLSDSLRKELQR